MALDHHRRVSAGSAPFHIPPAPPLPPQRYSDVAKNVFDRLRGSRKSATQPLLADDSKDGFFPPQVFGPTSSQTTSHKTGLKIRALDINRARSHVILAGGKILKTVRVEGTNCVEDFNLRSAAVNYWDIGPENVSPSKKGRQGDAEDVSSIQRATFDIEDVAWSNGNFDSIIATAVSNGKIVLYDLHRPGVVVQRLQEHYRQVHKVDFNPTEGKCLLSGSQDGTVILWDLRLNGGNAMKGTSRGTFLGRSEGVRHVKWSPVDTWAFAFGTDNGIIQRWDTRHAKGPVWKVNGHEGTCNSVDWHIDGKHLISAGKDKIVKVWNMSPDLKRRKPSFELRTPYEVQNVRWRPPCLVPDSQASSIKQCTHLATSYRHYPIIHIWDLRRPSVPFREVNHQINSGTTDMLWHSKDLLWTVGPEGEFCQTDIHYSPRTTDRRPMQAFALSPRGEITFFTRQRPLNGRQMLNFRTAEDNAIKRAQMDLVLNEKYGRSPGDDSLNENFLSTSYTKKQARAQSTNVKSNRFGTTPPSAEDVTRPVVPLDLSMRGHQLIGPVQTPKHGLLPGSMSATIFSYFAQKYKCQPQGLPINVETFFNLDLNFEKNSVYPLRASRHRDSQTWKIFGRQLAQDLRRKAVANREIRLHRKAKLLSEGEAISDHSPEYNKLDSKDLFKHETPQDTALFKNDSNNLKLMETSSNVPTPVARPVYDSKLQSELGQKLANDPIDLPPNLKTDYMVRHNMQANTAIPKDDKLSLEEVPPSWAASTVDNDERRAMVNQWRIQPKTPLNLDNNLPQSNSISIPPQLYRHDSGESFMMFSTSSGSQKRSVGIGSFASGMSPNISTEDDSWRGSVRNTEFDFQPQQHLQSSSSDLSDDRIPSVAPSMPASATASTGTVSRFNSPLISRSVSADQGDSMLTNAMPLAGVSKVNAITAFEPASILGRVSSDGLSSSHRSMSDPVLNDRLPSMTPQRPGSEPIVTNGSTNINKTPMLRQTSVEINSQQPPAPVDFASEEFIVSDFLSEEGVANSKEQKPANAIKMLHQLLTWYTDHSDAQMSAHLLLLSIPLLVSQKVQMADLALSNTMEQAIDQLSPESSPLTSIGLSPLLAESILTTYHEQLLSLELLIPAAILRRLAYPTFPGVYDQSLKDVTLGTLCQDCGNPINNPSEKLRCQSCRARQALCPICWLPSSPYGPTPMIKLSKRKDRQLTEDTRLISEVNQTPNKKTHLWSSCAICNHACHAACAHTWFHDVESEGVCPVAGCGCDCVKGQARDRRLASLQKEILDRTKLGGRRGNSNVKRDDWAVGESRAVGRARGALRGGVTSPKGV